MDSMEQADQECKEIVNSAKTGDLRLLRNTSIVVDIGGCGGYKKKRMKMAVNGMPTHAYTISSRYLYVRYICVHV